MYISILPNGEGIRNVNLPEVYFGDGFDFNQPGFHLTSGILNGLNQYNFVQREARTVLVSGLRHVVIPKEGLSAQQRSIYDPALVSIIDSFESVIKPYVLNICDSMLIKDFLFPEVILLDQFNFSKSPGKLLTTKSNFYFEGASSFIYIPYLSRLDTIEIVGYFKTDGE